MGSGDFDGQATEPQQVDMRQLAEKAGEGAVNDLYLSGMPDWEEIPATLVRYGFDILVAELIKAGHRDTTAGEIAIALGITYEDGSWT